MAKTTLVLVPGAWHLPTAWNPLIPWLEPFEAEAVSLPSVIPEGAEPRGMYDDAEAIRNVILKVLDKGDNAVIVAHSYGGVPANEACKGLLLADRKKEGKLNGVSGIIYLTSFALPIGQALWDREHDPEGRPFWDLSNGKTVKPLTPHDIFYNQLTAEEAKPYIAALQEQSVRAWLDKLTYDAHEHAPTAYLICTDDHAIPADVQRAIIGMSKKPYDLTREIPADHSPWLGKHREATAQFIKDAVQTFDVVAARQL